MRRRDSVSAVGSRWITLIATRRPENRSSARYTWLVAPLPRARTTGYFPIIEGSDSLIGLDCRRMHRICVTPIFRPLRDDIHSSWSYPHYWARRVCCGRRCAHQHGQAPPLVGVPPVAGVPGAHSCRKKRIPYFRRNTRNRTMVMSLSYSREAGWRHMN